MTYEEKLEALCGENENIRILTAENRAAIRSLSEKLRSRFIDFGIAEQTMVGAAAGMALRGRIPVVHALAAFLTMRAFEFIRTDVGIPRLPVKFIGGVPGFLSDANGPTHQALEDIALMRSIPSMHIFCPSDSEELVNGMAQILQSPFPWYVRFNARPPVIEHSVPFIPGVAETVSDGFDVAVVTYGMLLEQAIRAKELLDKAGVSVRLINLRALQPIDEAAILRAARETELIVSLEDHFLNGGLYTIICELLARNCTATHVAPMALEQRWFRPGLLPDVLEYEGFTGRQIAIRILIKLASLKRQNRYPPNGQKISPFIKSIC